MICHWDKIWTFSRFERGTETEEWKEDSGRVGPPGPGSDLRAQGEDLLSRQHREEVREHLRPGLRQRGHHAHADAGVREDAELKIGSYPCIVLRDYVGPPICVDEDSEEYCPGKIPGVCTF